MALVVKDGIIRKVIFIIFNFWTNLKFLHFTVEFFAFYFLLNFSFHFKWYWWQWFSDEWELCLVTLIYFVKTWELCFVIVINPARGMVARQIVQFKISTWKILTPRHTSGPKSGGWILLWLWYAIFYENFV